jgi:response regulator RpfG family c-di-GMP phosphodiesterase
MTQGIKVGIRFKILLIVLSIVICGFTVNGFVSVLSSRNNLLTLSNQFMQYKLMQIENYAEGQKSNLKNSGFADNPIYQKIVTDSIGTYAQGMITADTQVITAFDDMGTQVFSTSDIGYQSGDWDSILTAEPYARSSLNEYSIAGTEYIGLEGVLPDFQWVILVIENKESFTTGLVETSVLQGITVVVTLAVTAVGLIIVLNTMLSPLKRVRNAILEIISDRNFKETVKIEYPDEVGELAFDFNMMITSLDLASKKLKKYALDEAIATKEVFIREKETLDLLGRASDYKDLETGLHIRRVSLYSLVLSRAIGQDEPLQDLIQYAAPLHDVGKIGVADSILLKKGRLDAEELTAMRKHTTIGYEILNDFSSKYLKAGAIIAISHHEKYDGTGYPAGKSGEDIPIFGRIVSIADVLDALTTERPYKDAWPFSKAVEFILSESGKHFDPNLCRVFFEHISEIEDIFSLKGDQNSGS